MNAIQLYFRYIAISVRSQLEYRGSFLMQSIGTLMITGIEFLGIWALFERFGQVQGWTLPEVALIYGMISITFSFGDSIGRGFDLFGQMVKAGDFDRLLLRPRSTVLQLIGQEVTLRRVGRLVQGAIVLVYATLALQLTWTVPRIGLLILSVSCGACLFLGLLVLQATSCFWTTEGLEVWNAFTYGGVTMSHYPMSIYRDWFRRVFTFVIPLTCINYLPAVAIMGRPDPLGTTLLVQCLAPLAGPVFMILSLQFWKVGVRHYRSTGS